MRVRISIAAFAWLTVLLAAHPSPAQQAPKEAERTTLVAVLGDGPPLPAGGYVIRSDVREVRLDLRVKDGQGRPVMNLTRADLHVFDNQRRVRTLSSLLAEFDLPLTIAVLIDISGSTASVLSQEKQAALDFLQAVMRPGDRATVAGFANRLSPLEEVGAGLESWRGEIDGLRAGDLTALFDAAVELCTTRLRIEPGAARRRVLVILSDGADNYSRHSLDDAIEAAMKNEVTVFTVTIGRNVDHDQAAVMNLRYLSATTGGDSLSATRTAELRTTFEQIDRELRSYYVLTYPLPAQESGEEFHPVRITAAPEGWKVQAKVGYFARDGE